MRRNHAVIGPADSYLLDTVPDDLNGTVEIGADYLYKYEHPASVKLIPGKCAASAFVICENDRFSREEMKFRSALQFDFMQFLPGTREKWIN